ARMAAVFQTTRHRFAALREADHRSTLFGELSYSAEAGPAAVVAGISFQRDALHQLDLPEFDYTHRVPAAFGQVTVTASPRLTASLSGRCDDHNIYGLFCTPRVSVLLQPRRDFAG